MVAAKKRRVATKAEVLRVAKRRSRDAMKKLRKTVAAARESASRLGEHIDEFAGGGPRPKRQLSEAEIASLRQFATDINLNNRRKNGVMLSEGEEVTTTLYAMGAYGRRPTIKDWESGKDFFAYEPPIWKGTPYFSIGEAEFIYSLGYRRIVFGGDEGFDVDLVMR